MSAQIQVRRLSGSAIHPYLPDLARLRIQVFREYPYLYEGSVAYEEKYLRVYVDVPKSVMVLIADNEHIVGASSGLPLHTETPEVIAPFVNQGYNPNRIFYYGESVLLPSYRQQGWGKRFFEERETHARALGNFDYVCFCAVERPVGHPSRPADYVPLDAFWHRRGFVKHPELRTQFTWRDVGEVKETPKPMGFWLKRLT